MAEEALQEILGAFGIDSSEELGVHREVPASKITIYSNFQDNHAQMAFPNGFILIGLDSPHYTGWSIYDTPQFPEWYRRIVKHETMHVLQWLLGLDWERTWPWSQRVGRTWPEFWFSEGISEYISGGTSEPIMTLAQLDAWRESSVHVNPIGVRLSEDAPVPDSRIGDYYPMFGLAVRYLLDDAGLGRTLEDVKGLYLDMRTTVSFRESFESFMGVSVEEYEADFFELMEEYLR